MGELAARSSSPREISDGVTCQIVWLREERTLEKPTWRFRVLERCKVGVRSCAEC